MHDAQFLLDCYAETLGLAALPLNADGCARVVLDERTAINFETEPAAKCMHVFTLLGPVPDAVDANFLRALLEANLFTRETSGATLGIARKLGEVLICRRFELLEMDPASFCRAMDAFEASANTWRERLASGDFFGRSACEDAESMRHGDLRTVSIVRV